MVRAWNGGLNLDSPLVNISAVVSVHNSPYIEASLESLFKQTEQGLMEIIVVDDASTDHSVNKVHAVSQSDQRHRVRLVQLTKNSGPSAAKNAGIKASKGAYVATVDSDMVLENDCLQYLKEDLLDSGASSAMAYFLVPRDMRVLPRVIGYDLEFRLANILQGRHWVVVSKVGAGATLYSKSKLLEAGLFDETRRAGEDTDVGFRMSSQGAKAILSGRAKCNHYWQNRSLGGYVRQQIAYGEGALRALLKSGLTTSDPISNPRLRLNAAFATLSLLPLFLSVVYLPSFWFFLLAVLFQVGVDLPNAAWILREKKDVAGLIAPLIFIIRNYAWSIAVMSVTARYLIRRNRSGF